MANLFYVPLGVDFPAALVEGLRTRQQGQPPEAMARVQLYVNTARMQRRVRALLQEDAGFLPDLRLITRLTDLAPDIPAPVSPLRRRLELAQLVQRLIAADPSLAPKTAAFDLADSLAALMDEMQGEGVAPDALQNMDVAHHAEHWQRALTFLNLITPYFTDAAPDAEARQRMVAQRVIDRWQLNPPDHPVIIAGSTGSRGTTRMLMRAAADMPNGYVVLPGYDADQPAQVWDALQDPLTSEDHPQYRYALLMQELGLSPEDLTPWHDAPVSNPARGALISLALRPAPVTDQWMAEGPMLTDLNTATQDITLVEAASSRVEAIAIALRLREAAETGETAALITPDRVLTRQVTAALDRWRIEPDDSAGRPLPLSAPGRLLRHIADLFGTPLTAEALITLLKHPLINTGSDNRGNHLRWTRDLELHLRDEGLAFPDAAMLKGWAEEYQDGRHAWAAWLGGVLGGLEDTATRTVADFTDLLLSVTESLCNGPTPMHTSELWLKAAGEEALKWMTELRDTADAGGTVSPAEYAALLRAVLQRGEVRDPVQPHPNIMIWGTLEARVQGADLVILGGLNDGTWPQPPSPDPWMNREMRRAAGLLLPDRQIGLSAHDFQQGVMAPKVWITRSIRDAEAQTVPSRWLNRILNLLDGASDTGRTTVQAMRDRGTWWLELAAQLETPDRVDKATRPAPCPPPEQRPRRLSVTRIQTLIRDPYAIYAQYILQLKPLDPLRPDPDARLRGTVLHKVLERFLRDGCQTSADLMRIADEVLESAVPWPAARRLWRARLANVADWFIDTEAERRAQGTPLAPELPGKITLNEVDFTLTAKADRVDQLTDGRVMLYDYKTGTPPSPSKQARFDKQLLLEAAMAERGAFKDLGPVQVAGARYIGLGAKPKIEDAPVENPGLNEIWTQLAKLIMCYQSPDQGYTARRAMEQDRFGSDYDHLSRFGEWDATDEPRPEKMP